MPRYEIEVEQMGNRALTYVVEAEVEADARVRIEDGLVEPLTEEVPWNVVARHMTSVKVVDPDVMPVTNTRVLVELPRSNGMWFVSCPDHRARTTISAGVLSEDETGEECDWCRGTMPAYLTYLVGLDQKS